MKTKRLISLLLCIAMVVSCVFALDISFTAGAASTSAYQDMLDQTKPENQYGLADTVNEGAILQAFNWSFASITANLEKVAQQGFTTIQVSPPNEIKMPTKGQTVTTTDMSNGWWMFYQPAGFQVNESTDNALGTKDEFIDMIDKAHELGLKVIVDAVINHMGTDDDHTGAPYDNDSTDPMDHVTPRAAEFEPELLAAKAFHSPWKDMTYVENIGQAMRQYDSTGKPIPDPNCTLNWNCKYKCGGSATEYDIEESLTQHCTSGLPDLATETQLVQDTIYDYFVELIDECGADGFRFDAAKHIETLHDTYFPSDFWKDTLLKLREKYPHKECYAYGEILNKCGDGRPFSEYTELMDVTDSSSYWGIKNAVCDGNGNPVPYYPNDNFTKQNVIQWDESHDTYIDGSTSYLTVDQRNRIWALVAGRSVSTVVYLARPDDTATSKEQVNAICSNILLGEARQTSWANDVTKAINQFHNYFTKEEAEYCQVAGSYACIERGTTGAMIVSLGSAKSGNVTVANNILKDGTYIDAITGNKFGVAGGLIFGKVGESGVAAIYYDNDEIREPESDDPNVYPYKEGHKTVIFTNNKGWAEPINTYYWDSKTNSGPYQWPGLQMEYYATNDYGQKQYIFYLPEQYDRFIINAGATGGVQTVDMGISSSTGLYIAETKSGNNWNVESWIIKVDKPDAPTHPTTPTIPGDYSVGDADGDGQIAVIDATAIQRYCANLSNKSFIESAADADGDGQIAVLDATQIQRHCANLSSTLD